MADDQDAGNGTQDGAASGAEGATRHFTGGCHCGAVRFEASLDLSQTVACNCTICATKGLILTMVPEEDFALHAGDSQLREYRFNRHVISHMFCATCGVESFSRLAGSDGPSMVAVNVRTLEGVDPATLHPMTYDGRSA